jgi:hypothetical protein
MQDPRVGRYLLEVAFPQKEGEPRSCFSFHCFLAKHKFPDTSVFFANLLSGAYSPQMSPLTGKILRLTEC